MMPDDATLSRLADRDLAGYAVIDRALVVRAVGGCIDLWGEARNVSLTEHLPELQGMDAAIQESVAAGDELTVPLLNRALDSGLRYLDVFVRPMLDGSGFATAWLIDVTDVVQVSLRAAAALGGAGALHRAALRDQATALCTDRRVDTDPA